MRYVSTRGAWAGAPQPFCAILLEGLAPDGGLAVPEAYPALSRWGACALRPLSYRELAFAVLSRFIDDIPPPDLKALIERTYTAAIFGSDEITPVSVLEPGMHLLHVSNGPTLAFKDIALQLLGNLFEYVLAQRGSALNILGATSGDTGSSAEYAMRGKRGIRCSCCRRKGRMSPFQQAQMFSLADPNIHNLAIDGVFDDCQDIVKAVGVRTPRSRRAMRIGTVNSINWARVAAQIVYYFKGYFAVARSDGEPVDFAVPSGNFGNILAGHVAKRMGLPIRRLILATNENDVLDEFFRTGRYRPRGTARDARDVEPVDGHLQGVELRALRVRHRVGRDPAVVRDLWVRLAQRWRIRSRRHAVLGECRRIGLRVRREHACRSDRDDPRLSTRDPGSCSIRTPRTASGSGGGCAIRPYRSSASRPRCRPSSPRRSAKRSAAIPSGRRRTPISNPGRSAATCCPPTRRG